MADDDFEQDDEDLQPEDRNRPARRLAQAVVLRAALDFTEARDLSLWMDAERFFFGRDADFLICIEASGLDANWLRERLRQVRSQNAPPAAPVCKNCGPLPSWRFGVTCDGRKSSECRACVAQKATERRRSAGVPGSETLGIIAALEGVTGKLAAVAAKK